MQVVEIELRPGGIAAVFDDGTSVDGEYKLISGQYVVVGVSEAQSAALSDWLRYNIGQSAYELDPRFGSSGAARGGLQAVRDDRSPQLGGPLDLNGRSIRATTTQIGVGAFDLQLLRTVAGQTAQGDYSFLAAGRDNTAIGDYSFASGYSNTAYADYTSVFGASGYATIPYQMVLGGGKFSAIGDAQVTRLVLNGQSVGVAPCILGAGSSTGLALPINKAFSIQLTVGAAGGGYFLLKKSLLVTTTDTTGIVLLDEDLVEIDDANQHEVSVAFNSAGEFCITCQYSGSGTIDWIGYLEAVEVRQRSNLEIDDGTIGSGSVGSDVTVPGTVPVGSDATSPLDSGNLMINFVGSTDYESRQNRAVSGAIWCFENTDYSDERGYGWVGRNPNLQLELNGLQYPIVAPISWGTDLPSTAPSQCFSAFGNWGFNLWSEYDWATTKRYLETGLYQRCAIDVTTTNLNPPTESNVVPWIRSKFRVVVEPNKFYQVVLWVLEPKPGVSGQTVVDYRRRTHIEINGVRMFGGAFRSGETQTFSPYFGACYSESGYIDIESFTTYLAFDTTVTRTDLLGWCCLQIIELSSLDMASVPPKIYVNIPFGTFNNCTNKEDRHFGKVWECRLNGMKEILGYPMFSWVAEPSSPSNRHILGVWTTEEVQVYHNTYPTASPVASVWLIGNALSYRDGGIAQDMCWVPSSYGQYYLNEDHPGVSLLGRPYGKPFTSSAQLNYWDYPYPVYGYALLDIIKDSFAVLPDLIAGEVDDHACQYQLNSIILSGTEETRASVATGQYTGYPDIIDRDLSSYDIAWLNSTYLLTTSQSKYSTATASDVSGDPRGYKISHKLIARSFSDIWDSIPASAVIRGIEVIVRRAVAGGVQVMDDEVYLGVVEPAGAESPLGSPVYPELSRRGEDKASTDLWTGSIGSWEEKIYGGATDLWGYAWNRDLLANPYWNFGVAVSGKHLNDGSAYIESIRLRVYFD